MSVSACFGLRTADSFNKISGVMLAEIHFTISWLFGNTCCDMTFTIVR